MPELDDQPPSSPGVPTQRRWPVVVTLVVVALAVGLFVARQRASLDPLRVLVAVDVEGAWWEGSKPAAMVADELGERLAELGFDPVRAGDPETMLALRGAASPEAAAAELGAAFVLGGQLRLERRSLPVEGGFVEIACDDVVTLRHATEPEPLAEAPIAVFSGAKGEERALKLVAASAADHIVEALVPVLAERPELRALLEGRDPRVADRLAPAKAFVAAHRAQHTEAAQAYRALDEGRRRDEQRGPITFHSPPAADDRLVAVTERGLLVAVADVAPFLSHDLELLRSERLEAITWRPLVVGGEAAPLWRGYNAFTTPTASADGRLVAFVEDLYGWGRSVVLLAEGAPPKRLRTESERKLSAPRLSPDGALVALIDRACRGCRAELVVLDTASGDEVWRLGEPDHFYGGYAWLEPGRLMVVMKPMDDEPGLWSLHLPGGERRALLAMTEDQPLTDPVASPDGQRVAAALPQAAAIVTRALDVDEPTRHLVAGKAAALAFSPDGARIAFELLAPGRRHAEIALLALEGSEVTLLTTNEAADRHPRFAPDGARVYFEAADPDPVFPKQRRVGRVASVELR